MDDRFASAVGVAIIVGVIWWLLNSRYNAGRLAGIREATCDISRACSYHYELKDEPLPEKVDKALNYMAGALKRGKGIKARQTSIWPVLPRSATPWARPRGRRAMRRVSGRSIRTMERAAST